MVYLPEWASPDALRGVAACFVPPSMVTQKDTAQLGLWKAQITSRWDVRITSSTRPRPSQAAPLRPAHLRACPQGGGRPNAAHRA